MKKLNQNKLLCFIAMMAALFSAFDARANYQSTVLGDNPIAYYPLDLGVDTNGYATDVSGNGNMQRDNGLARCYMNIFLMHALYSFGKFWLACRGGRPARNLYTFRFE